MAEHRALIRIGEAAAMLCVSTSTLRKWEVRGELKPRRKSAAGTRFYGYQDILDAGGLPLDGGDPRGMRQPQGGSPGPLGGPVAGSGAGGR